MSKTAKGFIFLETERKVQELQQKICEQKSRNKGEFQITTLAAAFISRCVCQCIYKVRLQSTYKNLWEKSILVDVFICLVLFKRFIDF